MAESDENPAQPLFAFLLDLQGAVKLVGSDIALFPKQLTESYFAGA
jgi:hypothetical protein